MKFTRLFIVFTLLLGISEAQTIKFATVAPEGSTYLKVLREYTDEVTKLTGEKVKFKIYPSQIQGDEKDVLRKIRLGQLHSAGFTGVGLGEIMPEVRVLELPMLFHTYEEVDHIAAQFYDEFERKFEQNGFIILGWADVGFAYVYAQRPILTLADLKGAKMWMWEGDPLAEATFKALGVSAIPLSLTDVLTSLQTGLIETVYVHPLGCVALQWYTRVKTMMDVPLANVSGAVLISKNMFDKLEPAHQTILREKGREYMAKLVRLGREDNQASIELMKKNGMEVVKVPEKNLQEFYNACKTAHQNLVGKLYSQELLNKVNASLEQFRAEKSH
ncbi:MAG: TRAP transporter substrate-binding protein DctP [Calditrichaceae bacterium]|nr:TRAP transporter substrate-binding protein DctP [Calditrichia bacterium]NUQ41657.1 TRAP transporter substrate-binding protein DctP [Calditrichaceae bacterium]